MIAETAPSSEKIKTITDLQNSISARKRLTPGQLIWIRFTKHRTAVAGSIGLIILLLFIIIGSIAVSEDFANEVNLKVRLQAPTAEHYFGTDNNGRDVFARIIYGGQISLVIGILAVLLAVTIGTLVGSISGYFGGWVDAVLMRFTESILSLPVLFIVIILGKYLGKDIQTINLFGRTFSGSVAIVIFVIGATSWMYLSRIVRANVLSIREMDYITAAHASGVRNRRILFRHILPNNVGPIIVAATLGLASAIITEAYVSFLALGVQPPTASWGNMMTQSISFIQRGAWWIWIYPSGFIIYTILCINLMGDGLRDALDPRSSRHTI